MAVWKHYSPLDLSEGEIRLLILEPGDEDQPIAGTLTHTHLKEPRPYQALSYTWGSSANQVPISINGYPFMVSSNLYAALLEFRDRGKEIVIWIDAICINQGDIEERNAHVPMMHEVYSRAARVIVWLGRESEDSNLAMTLLPTIIYDAISNPDDYPNILAGRLSQEEMRLTWRPLARLFARPWWTRVWVLQEVALASSHITVRCGGAEQPWKFFVVVGVILHDAFVAGAFNHHPRIISDSILAGITVSSWPSEITSNYPTKDKSWTLEHALTKLGRLRDATDPRDKVFGVLNLMPVDQWPCRPDYSLDIRTLYVKVALHIIEKNNDLHLLASCVTGDWPTTDAHLRGRFRRSPITGNIPSWVPNWTQMRYNPPFPGGIESTATVEKQPAITSNNNRDPCFRVESGDILVVFGRLLGEIGAVGGQPVITRPYDLFDGSKMLAFANFIYIHLLGTKTEEVTSEMCLDTEWTLMTCFTSKPLSFTKTHYASWRQSGSPEPSSHFVDVVISRLHGRQVMSTSNGHLGLVPFGAKAGDCVAILKGCHVPMVLRPVEEEEAKGKGKGPSRPQRYIVIGEAYAQGYDAVPLDEDPQFQSMEFQEFWLQ
ncbi:heterokaryon incompatibility protein-domain-containing protein [Xylaria cf. heliscus]|nr:heterokaryon incompatibility protein-domain-containing protein [Xylaria cf. heliscus]